MLITATAGKNQQRYLNKVRLGTLGLGQCWESRTATAEVVLSRSNVLLSQKVNILN